MSELIDRLWESSQPVTETGCWLWLGHTDRAGYGRISVFGRARFVHRLAYADLVGEIPSGLVVMHKCDVPNCWNPSHLALGTQLDNIKDRDSKGRAAKGASHARLKGVENGKAKLTDATVVVIRSEYAQGGISQSGLAKKYGVHQGTISPLLLRKTWRHVA